jgi:hypothetical protein
MTLLVVCPFRFVAYPDTSVLAPRGMKFAAINFFHTYLHDCQVPPVMLNILEELGKTADEVANSLRARCIHGVRNTARFLNPIVSYADTRIANTHGIDILQGDRLRIVYPDGKVSDIPVPDPVLEFLTQFHNGLYPDLEEPTQSRQPG